MLTLFHCVGVIVRRAPGIDDIDYGQFVTLPDLFSFPERLKQELQNVPIFKESPYIQPFETSNIPCGMFLKLVLLESWGDFHYIGLNGIEVYDYEGNPLIATSMVPVKVTADPSSVNAIPGQENDSRIVENLIDGVNETYDDRHMWLTPCTAINKANLEYKKKKSPPFNVVYLIFEKPISISCINFWNYSKTPNRGVREVEIFLDENIIYKVNPPV